MVFESSQDDKEGWREVPFSEVCEHSAFGPRFSGEEYAPDGNVATLRTTDIREDGRIDYDGMPLARLDLTRLKQHLLKIDDLVITRSGRIGTPAVFNGFRIPVLPGAFLIRFRLDQRIASPLFYRYFFMSEQGQGLLHSVATGSVQQNINITNVHGLRVPLPPLTIQNEVTNLLSMFDNKIALLRETNATLEAIAQAIFKSWFVDFDPVRAKAEGREPEAVPPEVADLFPSEFEGSELGAIPKGWQVATFQDLTEVLGGSTPSTKNSAFWEDGVHHWATPKDLSGMDTPVMLETERKITNLGLEKISSGLLPAGTVLLSSRAPIGYLAIAEVPVAVNQGFIAMKARRGVSNLFLLRTVQERMEDIKSRANGSTFMEISKGAFRPIPALLPPSALMQGFDSLVRPLYQRLVENQRERATLTELRDTLLPRLMSGKLRIPDLEEVLT